MKKICKRCVEDKNVEEFRKHIGICKKCEAEKSLEYYKDNKEKIKERSKNYNNTYNGSDKCKETKKRWRKTNVDNIKKYNKEKHIKSYPNNKIEICEKNRNYRSNNLEKFRNREKIKRDDDSYREYRRKYIKAHSEKNPHVYAWRSLLRNALKRLGMKKEGKTIDILGFSALDLKIVIENKFTTGMTWENYGEWHIDHIKPVILFGYDTNPSIVNALTNLNPMWSTNRVIDGILYEGNLNKGKKFN